MITLQHSLVTLLHHKGDMDKFKQEIPYALLCDGIRAYSGPRQYSHFEESRDGSDVSWMEFPEDIQSLTPNFMSHTKAHLVENIQPCCMGEKTNIQAFVDHNQHLSEPYFTGVKHHLIQDSHFDTFVREQIDCSQMYDDTFTYRDTQMNGKEVRGVIAEMEKSGVYVLAKQVYEKCGITVDQQWFDENVKAVLDQTYPSDLAESTYKYMQIDPEVNELIQAHDWSKATSDSLTLDVEAYEKVCDEILDDMAASDGESVTKEQEITKSDELDDAKAPFRRLSESLERHKELQRQYRADMAVAKFGDIVQQNEEPECEI